MTTGTQVGGKLAVVEVHSLGGQRCNSSELT